MQSGRNWHFRGTYWLHQHSILNVIALVKAAGTSETPVGFYQTIQHNIPENHQLHTDCCKKQFLSKAYSTITFLSHLITVIFQGKKGLPARNIFRFLCGLIV
jgi:hypothetical protein